jgi:hypothetical protein
MYTFSELEKDEKTFSYVKEYASQWRADHHLSFAKIDMNIQMREIAMHLFLNGKGPKNDIEVLTWIQNYGPTFRAYLNSIKLIFLTWHCMGHDFEDITWEDFCLLRDRISEVKDVCVDSIVVERESTQSFALSEA